MSDIEINLEINKKKSCKIKLTEEEKKRKISAESLGTRTKVLVTKETCIRHNA